MLAALRTSANSRTLTRAFSTTPSRASDLAKLTLIGTLVKDPEGRLTKNDKEFITYTVVTRGAPLAASANGERQYAPSTFHRILSFNDSANKFLRTLRKGSKVYVESSFELREPDANADPTTPQGQRQIFLKHETIRVITYGKTESSETSHSEESTPF